MFVVRGACFSAPLNIQWCGRSTSVRANVGMLVVRGACFSEPLNTQWCGRSMSGRAKAEMFAVSWEVHLAEGLRPKTEVLRPKAEDQKQTA